VDPHPARDLMRLIDIPAPAPQLGHPYTINL
jgi:hypothetical protein